MTKGATTIISVTPRSLVLVVNLPPGARICSILTPASIADFHFSLTVSQYWRYCRDLLRLRSVAIGEAITSIRAGQEHAPEYAVELKGEISIDMAGASLSRMLSARFHRRPWPSIKSSWFLIGLRD